MNGQPDRPKLESEDVNPEVEAGAEDAAPDEADPEAVLAELQAKADENWDRYLRSAAEVEKTVDQAERYLQNTRES